MNDEDLLNVFFERVEEIAAGCPESEWGALIRSAFPESLIWDSYVASMVEVLCGGDVFEVDKPVPSMRATSETPQSLALPDPDRFIVSSGLCATPAAQEEFDAAIVFAQVAGVATSPGEK